MVTASATAAQIHYLNANSLGHRGKSIPEYVKEKECYLLTSSSTGGNSSLPGVQLKHNHRYFTQVQHQLFECEKEEEYFYVYTTKDTFTEKIT